MIATAAGVPTSGRASARPPGPGSSPPSPRRPRPRSAPGGPSPSGRNALVVAPTGSGKTLSAFLWSLDRLAAAPPPEDKKQRLRVLYVSPLKALAVDVERNLRAPLSGIRHTAARLGLPEPDITVGLRSGDTPAADRRRLAEHAPRHPDHHARVAVPDADLAGPRDPPRRGDGHRRRGARRRRHQARRPPGPLPRASRRAAPPARPADRPLRHRPPDRGGRPLPRRLPPRRGRRAARPPRSGTCGSSYPSRTWASSAPPVRSSSRAPPPAPSGAPRSGRTSRSRRRPGRAAPLHHRLRQLPPPRRAPHRKVQRDRHRPRRTRREPPSLDGRGRVLVVRAKRRRRGVPRGRGWAWPSLERRRSGRGGWPRGMSPESRAVSRDLPARRADGPGRTERGAHR